MVQGKEGGHQFPAEQPPPAVLQYLPRQRLPEGAIRLPALHTRPTSRSEPQPHQACAQTQVTLYTHFWDAYFLLRLSSDFLSALFPEFVDLVVQGPL